MSESVFVTTSGGGASGGGGGSGGVVVTSLPIRDCRGCFQQDDHPRVAYGYHEVDNADGSFSRLAAYYHYDCLPEAVKADLIGDQSTERQQTLAQIIDHAEGVSVEHFHGPDLRQKVVELMTPVNERELAAHQAAADEEQGNG